MTDTTPFSALEQFIALGHDEDFLGWPPAEMAAFGAFVDSLSMPACSCHGIRHAVLAEDRRRVRGLEQAALAEERKELADYYNARLSPCCTVDPTPEMVAARAAADLRNGGPR